MAGGDVPERGVAMVMRLERDLEVPEIVAMPESGAVIRRKGKQEDFGYILDTHYPIEINIARKYGRTSQPIFHFDLYAGAGYVALDDGSVVEGSPIIAARTYARGELPVRAYFFEEQSRWSSGLQVNLDRLYWGEWTSPGWDYHVVPGDHHRTAPLIIDRLWQQQRNPYGLVYADPYGRLPVTLLMQFADRFKRVDQLLCVAATGYKRFRQGPAPHYLERDIQMIDKRHVWVRETRKGDAWHQTMIFLTNWDEWPHLTKLGFWPLKSPEGRAIMDRLNYSENERQEMGQ